MAWGILLDQGSNPSPALAGGIPNHWTTREVKDFFFFGKFTFDLCIRRDPSILCCVGSSHFSINISDSQWLGKEGQDKYLWLSGGRRAQIDLCALFKFWTWFFYFTLLFEEFSNIVWQLEDGKKWRNLSVWFCLVTLKGCLSKISFSRTSFGNIPSSWFSSPI